MKTLENFREYELTEHETSSINGGAGWGDLFWMFAEDIVNGYISACEAVVEGYADGTVTNVGSKR